MNVMQFFEDLVDRYNLENKCGLCWTFVGGGRDDYSNLYNGNSNGQCCVIFAVNNIRINPRIETTEMGTIRPYTDYAIRLLIGAPSGLDLIVYNEVEGMDKGNSKWVKYINPLIECIGNGLPIDYCLNNNVELTAWNSEVIFNKMDYNIDGLIVNATFREYAIYQ